MSDLPTPKPATADDVPEPTLLLQLHAVAEPWPSEHLWPRIQASLARERRRRRRARVLGIGLAAGVILAALGATLRSPQPEPAQSALVSPAPVSTAPSEELQTIDRFLQAAFDAGLSDADLAPMWRARQQVLNRTGSHRDAEPTTIEL